jgi:hypothetical protein
MAKTALARRFGGAPKFRRPSPMIAKLKDKLRSASRRVRSGGAGSGAMADLVAMGGAAALGKLEQMGTVPARIGPVDSALVIGGLGAFVLPKMVKGKAGRLAHDATLGALCVAGYRLGSGQPLMAGDEMAPDDLSGNGGWGPAE